MDTIGERVAAGVKLLDKKSPGWRERVSVNDLSVRSTYNCVLGQAFGHYGRGLKALGLDYISSGRPYGFYAEDNEDLEEWKALDLAWRVALAS